MEHCIITVRVVLGNGTHLLFLWLLSCSYSDPIDAQLTLRAQCELANNASLPSVAFLSLPHFPIENCDLICLMDTTAAQTEMCFLIIEMYRPKVCLASGLSHIQSLPSIKRLDGLLGTCLNPVLPLNDPSLHFCCYCFNSPLSC